MKSLSWSEMCTLMFTEVLVMIAKVWKKTLKHAWTNKWFKKCYTHTQRNVITQKKKEHCGHYAKWNETEKDK